MNSPTPGIVKCRVCGSNELREVIDLGAFSMTGIFPKVGDIDPPSAPLILLICENCSLCQLKHSVDPKIMYGESYGYKSSLNSSMQKHLQNKVIRLASRYAVENSEVILDIGSNDGTSCNEWLKFSSNVFGFDPTASKFASNYDPRIKVNADFFNSDSFLQNSAKAKIVTSIAMFYDLEDPVDFVQNVHNSLTDKGIWHFEQSYLPSMLKANAYDTICHEHLEYYSLSSIIEILDRANMKVVDASLNDINGGSIAVTAAKISNKELEVQPHVKWMLEKEKKYFKNNFEVLDAFAVKVANHKEELHSLVAELAKKNTIWGLGASTKGNVLLQYCGITNVEIDFIADVNPDKWNCQTPGSRIPICSENDILNQKPDYLLVMPWHFRSNLLGKSEQFINEGIRYIFPLPDIEVVSI
jgi:hypothetical protein